MMVLLHLITLILLLTQRMSYLIISNRITIKGSNIAGESTNPAVITIIKEEPKDVEGLSAKVYKVQQHICYEGTGYPYTLLKEVVIDNLNGLDGNNAYSEWDKKLGGVLSENGNIKYWRIELEGKVLFESDVTHFFTVKGDGFYADLEIDGIPKADPGWPLYTPDNKYSRCYINGIKNNGKGWSKLAVGFHNFKLDLTFSDTYMYGSSGHMDDEKKETRDTSSSFMIQMRPNSQTVAKNVVVYLNKSPFYFVSELSFERDYYTIPLGSKVEIPFKFSKGTPSQCSGTTSDGITIDMTKRIISVMINTAGKYNFSMSCSTDNAVTNTATVTIEVLNSYVSGIVGYYLKADSTFDSSCSNPYTSSTQDVHIEIIKLEDDINHDYSNTKSIWDDLTPNFLNEFGVSWEGYLKVDNEDDYVFNLTSVDGSWLFIDYEEIINHSGNNEWSSVLGTKRLMPGYHLIRVNYMRNTGASGILLYFKGGDGGEYKSIKNHVYFVPNGDFEYSVSYASYIVDEEIGSNIPRIQDNKAISECKSNPTLPPSLTLEDDCTIRGIPNSEQSYQKYDISGIIEGKTVSTSITIGISQSIKPQNIHIEDSDENVYSQFNLILGKESRYIIRIGGGFLLYFELGDEIEGFKLNKITGELTMIVYNYLTDFELEIKAYYGNNDYVSKKFGFNVTSGCTEENKKSHFVKLISDANPTGEIECSYSDLSDTQIQSFHFSDYNGDMYTEPICLIPGDYKFRIQNVNIGGSGNIYMFFYTDGKQTDEAISEVGKNNVFDIDTEIKSPTLEYPDDMKDTYYINDDINIVPRIKMVNKCIIDPELPPSLSFNNKTCAITGKPTYGVEETEYTITATGINGNTILSFNFTFYNETINEVCYYQQKTLLHVHIKSNENSNSWTYLLYKTSEIDKDNRKPLVSLSGSTEGWKNKELIDYDYCLESNDYTIIYRSSSTANGWGDSYIETSVNGIAVVRKSLKPNQDESNDVVYGVIDYNYDTKWEYNTQYQDGWDDITKAKKWNEIKLSDLPKSASDNVYYIRKIDRFSNTEGYSAFALKMSYLSGILIKMNGKELFRNNLPDGEITENTMANNKYNEITDEVLLLTIPMLEEPQVIITIELHKHSDEDSFPVISVDLLKIKGTKTDCLIINKYLKPVTETNTDIDGEYKASNGFDENINTEWSTSVSYPYSVIRFKDHYHSYFNQLSVHSSSSENQPKSFSLEGYIGNSILPLATFTNIEYPSSDLTKTFPNYETTKMYDGVKISLLQSSGNNKYDIRDINLHLCPMLYCKEFENLPDTLTGSDISIGCREGGEGNRTFYCGNDKEWYEKMNNCKEGPSVITSEASYTVKAGTAVEDLHLFRMSGNKLVYTMSPEIEGLTIDRKTGIINGKPYKEYTSKNVDFIISNTYGTKIITIPITITPSNVPIKIWANDTIEIIAGNEIKIKPFLFTGVNITYSVDKLPSGLSLDKTTGVISGMTLEETIMDCSFKAENSNDKVLFYIKINVSLPVVPYNTKYVKEMNITYGMSYSSLQPYQCIAKSILYSVEPKLPEGLVLDEKNGIISGKVNVRPPSDESYTFKCYNDVGDSIPNPIVIHIQLSIEPIIISSVDMLKLEGGKELNETLCEVTGEKLSYSISKLPSETLTFDTKTGRINGYIKKEFPPSNVTVTIYGISTSVSFSFIINCVIPKHPVVVPSTEVEKIEFKYGDPIKSTFLFIAVGDNIIITVEPDLPKGIKLDPKTGEIFGTASEYIKAQKYKFIIRNPPSTVTQEEIVEISFDAILCKADSGFSESVAEKGGKEVLIDCGGSKSGMKIRKCLLTDGNTGVWSAIDDSQCKISDGAIAGIAVGSVAGGILVIMLLFCCFVRTGMFTKRATSKSSLSRGAKIPEKQVAEGIRI